MTQARTVTEIECAVVAEPGFDLCDHTATERYRRVRKIPIHRSGGPE